MTTDEPLWPGDWDLPAAATETHISVLAFVGDRVYKALKPVRTDFLDHTTAAARRKAAEAELALNRRLAPDVYLGLLEVDGGGGPREPVIAMRRMPAERRLAALVTAGEGDDCVRAVARSLAAFHAAAPSTPAIRAAGAPAAVWDLWRRNAAALREAGAGILDTSALYEAERRARDYVLGRSALFEARVVAGRVRDGHGDLLADDIFCLSDGPRILDCLAFDDQLRHGDVLADVGFLAMDLERLGRADLAVRLLAWYREFSFEQHPASLAHHYIAYRAHVRAKVACLRAAQGGEGAAEDARHLMGICLARLRRAQVRLVAVGGPPGSGKSTLSDALSRHTGAALLRSDELRKDLAGLAHDARGTTRFGEGIYRPERTADVYRELLRRAERLLVLGESVVLDASWSSEREREAVRAVAAGARARLIELRCDAPADLADERIAARDRAGGAASDATVGVARAMRARFDAWPSAQAVDTAGSVEATASAAVTAFGEY